MAEAREEGPPPSLPPRGRVESVRKQWSVHEDGALAYQIQNEEITQHYGLNRFNRRTVREDIPVAKIVQSEEELRQQEERMRELEALKAQAEEDELVARQVSEQLKREGHQASTRVVLDDEELARQMQEKEKKKYERHLEKKREKKLKQERQRLEAELARDLEDAGLPVNSDGSDHITESVESLDVQGVNSRRVTPAGRIEDEGDFSDFYRLPDEMDEFTRLEIQACQDEELARLLQEQEHKRSKAEVDKNKMKKIEQQDEELAKVIQEQEKLRLKKAKHRHQQKKEAQKLKEAESLPLGASANSMNVTQHTPRATMSSQQQHSPSISPTIPVAAGATRYRRNSYTQAFDSPPSPPSPPRTQPPPRPVANRNRQDQQQHHQAPSPFSSSPSSQIPPSSIPHSSSVHRNPQQQPPGHHLANRPPMPLPSQNASQGMSTLESARRIAAGDHNGILAAQQTSMPSPRMGGTTTSSRDGVGTNVDVIRSSGRGRGQNNKVIASQSPGMASNAEALQRQLSQGEYRHQQPHHQQYPENIRYDEDDVPEVSQWIDTQEEFGSGGRGRGNHNHSQQRRQQNQQHWQHATSYSDEEEDFGSHQGSPHMNGMAGFNIAAAIDPTYQKRHPEAAIFPPDNTQVKRAIPFSRSLPQADGEVEWDPGLRGSLRKTKAPIHGYPDSTAVSTMGSGGGDPSWQPVQGQRRGDTKSKKSSKQPPVEGKKDRSGNCKQQ